MKRIRMVLDQKGWEELQALKKGLKVPKMDGVFGKKAKKEPETYEEYLEEEKNNPKYMILA